MSDLIGIIDEIGITKNVYRTASKLVRKEKCPTNEATISLLKKHYNVAQNGNLRKPHCH